MKTKYKITLESPGLNCSYEADDKEPIINAWNNKTNSFCVLNDKTKGRFYYDLSKFHCMTIAEIK